ncbi:MULTISPECIES: leucine-rich repeat-containing protein kinase family protein [unclassified Janthinobacterium]|uniref:leucine-rich repeat-containing protein kinase family protein n=1 Tax=unclassified Janthinobacterium TaxID=2610881 RepID=UPI0027127F8E|nr:MULTISPECIES: leucine-rich repeat-containing protein kinase family protein [unclassified Janthinobacterium]MDO8067652.1 leucine-rich repeat-containing protein kinase family protein [Janthinobacterium sp. SUN206]MED5616467.1 leucine-rich repeat-containing protein kinase family protein [Janthinobacterium sp. P210005]
MHTLEQLRAGQLAGLRRLTLSCGLTAFPREIFDLADSLEILDLSGNALSTLPDDLPRLHKLRIIFCSDNLFTSLPAVLGSCPALEMIGFKANRIRHVPAAALPSRLRWLTLTDNAIEALPEELGKCGQLQKLMLAGNCLDSLPASLANCRRLELVRIAANRFTALPDCLLSLPCLSWLAYAGNPFTEARELAALAGSAAAGVAWQRLVLAQQLGEGASGVIYRARLDGADEVAVKVFKGAMTSDGLPRSEMAACVGAGAHPGLIPILGTLDAHPQGALGLVMPLVDAAFRNLAGPPSLESCTRDVYADGARFDFPQALAIAHGIASAVRQLHAHGIVHGDLYAHNILHADAGACLLGDFGAASMFAPGSSHGDVLQGIEARAFGVLLGELIAHCATPLPALHVMMEDCLQEEALQRPSFDVIERALRDMFPA